MIKAFLHDRLMHTNNFCFDQAVLLLSFLSGIFHSFLLQGFKCCAFLFVLGMSIFS